MAKKIIIGTRGSELALWQANFVKKELKAIGADCQIKTIKTSGDNLPEEKFTEMSGQGFFTKEIELSLLNKEIDLAIHSYKDLPTTPARGLMVAAVTYREDPSEMILINKDAVDERRKLSLKKEAIVGTSSPRRKVQMLAMRTDLHIEELRGNILTRIEKLKAKKYDAICIAAAAIKRLKVDITGYHSIKYSPQEFIPAPAQGVLALQIKEDNQTLKTLLKKLNHAEVEEVVTIERLVFNHFKGGCRLPLGIYSEKQTDEAGKGLFKVYVSYSPAENTLPRYYHFQTYNPSGWADKIVEKIKSKHHDTVFITRDLRIDEFFIRVLKANGYTISGKSFIEFKLITINRIPQADWLFFSSKHAVKYFYEQNPKIEIAKIGAIGKSTAAAVRDYGKRADFIGYSNDTRLTGRQFASMVKSQKVLFPQAKGSMRTIQQQFVNRSQVIDLAVYETMQKPVYEVPDAGIMIFTSPSNAEAFLERKKLMPEQKIIAMGDATAHILKQAGVKSIHLVPAFNDVGILQAIFSL